MKKKFDLKEFLKPTLGKIILLVIFTIMSSLPVFHPITKDMCPMYPDAFCTEILIGLPMGFYAEGSGGFSGRGFVNLRYEFLIIDILFWYLISCLIFWVYKKVKK